MSALRNVLFRQLAGDKPWGSIIFGLKAAVYISWFISNPRAAIESELDWRKKLRRFKRKLKALVPGTLVMTQRDIHVLRNSGGKFTGLAHSMLEPLPRGSVCVITGPPRQSGTIELPRWFGDVVLGVKIPQGVVMANDGSMEFVFMLPDIDHIEILSED